ncbi:MAG: hypothetical protein IJP92_12325 [Lachnospiraceae bacterium]|nr:hypothetical protein [Lachnospiraceae bacterium]
MTGDGIHFEFDGKKKMTIQIMDSQYTIILGLSFTDIETVCDGMADETPDYKRVVASIIQSHIGGEEKPSLDSIMGFDISVFRAYISGCVSNTEFLQEEYDAFSSIDDECERFCKSAEAYYLKQTESLRETLKNYTFPTLKIPEGLYENIAVSMGDLFSSYGQMASRSIIVSTGVGDLIQNAMDSLRKTIEEQQKLIIDNVKKALTNLPKPFSEFTKDEFDRFVENHKKWGEYGWTYPPHIRIDEFFSAPENKSLADRIVMKYCTDQSIGEVIEKTKEFRGLRKRDYDEAINCFNNKKYKSCAMIITSMVEARLIRLQKIDKSGKKRRLVGVGAVKVAQMDIEESKRFGGMLFHSLQFNNVFSCLSKFFEDTKDFKIETKIINRNFLMHGMLTRPVYKRDCIQLLLLYYNLMKLLER